MTDMKKMQSFFYQQLDEQRNSEKKRRERSLERDKKLEKRNKIIEYAKLVKFGDLQSIPKNRTDEEKIHESGK